jgi:cysteine synthase
MRPDMAQSLLHSSSILDAIGGTPTLELHRLAAGLFAKLEQLNPTGSAADRVARALVEEAEADGRLAQGGTVVEATLGNMGLALAQVCAVRGHRLIATMPESMSLERRGALRLWGARVELTAAERHLEGAMARAEELARGEEGALLLPQWRSARAALAHEEGTGAELVRTVIADGGRIDAFVAPVATGATLTGVGRALRRAFPEVALVAVVPKEGEGGTHRVQGLTRRRGAAFDPSLVTRTVAVEGHRAWEVRGRLAAEHGLLVGLSAGAAVAAALEMMSELGSGARVYTVLWDTGERYFSLAERFR